MITYASTLLHKTNQITNYPAGAHRLIQHQHQNREHSLDGFMAGTSPLAPKRRRHGDAAMGMSAQQNTDEQICGILRLEPMIARQMWLRFMTVPFQHRRFAVHGSVDHAESSATAGVAQDLRLDDLGTPQIQISDVVTDSVDGIPGHVVTHSGVDIRGPDGRRRGIDN